MSNVLTRMGELSEQSAQTIFASSQRSALQSEFIALGSELERIAATTVLTVELLSGGAQIDLQIGFNSASTSQIGFTGVNYARLTRSCGE